MQSDDRTLQNYGLFDNCVVHCLVHNQRTSNSNVDNGTNSNIGEDVQLGGADAGDMRDWDLSHVLYISMFVMLSTAWYLRINFSQFFSATATVALFGLSGIFIIFLVGAYIPDQDIVLRTWLWEEAAVVSRLLCVFWIHMVYFMSVVVVTGHAVNRHYLFKLAEICDHWI